MSAHTHRLNLAAAAVLCIAAALAAPALASAAAGDSAPTSSYGWPLVPFHRQHAVRGFFGDPRIGRARDGSVIRSFHFGIDIAGPDGEPVYATLTGTVRSRTGSHDVVSIAGRHGRVFAYWHVVPTVHPGQHVVAYRTLLGHIAKGWGHVHFAEYSAGTPLNPLRPGALGPYHDTTSPSVTGLGVPWEGLAIPPQHPLSGAVDFVVSAFDLPSIPVGGAWSRLTAAPALVRWRVDDRAWQTALDFRRVIPRPDGYDRVYAYHTHQNRPHRRGNYLIYLARGWNTDNLAPGVHTLDVAACDIGANCSTAQVHFVSKRAES